MYFSKTPALAKHLFKDITWNIPTNENSIYLTFDDGPAPGITEWTLGCLKRFNAKATFFCLGKNINKYPEIFRNILAAGHAVGNHTYDHLNGWKTNNADYFENIRKCEDEISKFTSNQQTTTCLPAGKGKNQKSLFRPPYGKIKKSQISDLKSQYSIVLWDVLCGDFDASLSGEKCFKNVVENGKKGSIIVFHDSEKAKANLFYALPRVLEYFSEKGFVFMTLPHN